MSISNKRDYEQLKSKLPINTIAMKLLPSGIKQGKEWVSLNPRRNDNKIGSFKVNTETGIWKDFATGDGGDIVDLWAYIQGCDTNKAYDDLAAIYHGYTPPPQKPKEPEPILIYPVPINALPLPDDNRVMLWEYRNEQSELLFYIARYNWSDGRKHICPWTYRIDHEGRKQWHKKGIGENKRPLYKIPELIARPSKNVLIVEGEKAADAASRLLPDWVCITWHGGANAVHQVDFSHLRGRKVVCWPDNDKDGISAMDAVKTAIKDIASSVRVIDLKWIGSKAPKWDLADAEQEGATTADIMELINRLETTQELDAFPMLSEKGNPLNLPENIEHLINHYRITLKFNEIIKKIDAVVPYADFSTTNKEQLILIEIKRLCIIHGVPKVDVEHWILFIADKFRYNPVKQWIQTKPWDGISRFDEFANTLQCKNNSLRDILLKTWMIGAITVAYNESGRALHGVLTLLGEPSLGKSSWIKKLIPQELNLMIRDFSLNPNDKDSIMQATGNWLCELSEVDAMVRKADVASVKSFLTRDIDIYRAPYARGETRAPRRTAFLASVNDDKFLRDLTGNRRWWLIETLGINYEHNIDMQQLWAEIEHCYKQGEKSYLTRGEEKLLNANNEEYISIEPLQELVLQQFCWDEPERHYLTCTQILMLIGYNKPTKAEANTMASILKKMGVKKGENRKYSRHYFMPRHPIEKITTS